MSTSHGTVFAVVGAGHGGQAMAAHLALQGFRTRLYNRRAHRLYPIRVRGGIELDGEVRGFARLEQATTDLRKAIDGADVIMVVVPAFAHAAVARAMAPHLASGQVVLLNPGRTGGALEFAHVLEQAGCQGRAIVAEAQTFIFASRSVGPAMSRIFRIKNAVPIAALPAGDTASCLERVVVAFPQFVAAPNVLKTGLDNVGAIFHPAPTILNAGRIEDTHGAFEYYHGGITPSVARVMEALDAERVAVGQALGIEVMTAHEWLEMAYGATGQNLWEAVLDNVGYAGIRAPASMETRYLSEDVPAGLVPMASLGRLLSIPTPTMDAIITLASTVHAVDYWAIGRTVERLGLAGLELGGIRALVEKGGMASAREPAAIVGA